MNSRRYTYRRKNTDSLRDIGGSVREMRRDCEDLSGLEGQTGIAAWVGEITKAWARGPASTLELARLICAVRKQARRSQWTQLWSSDGMPFSKRKGEMLVVIGDGLGWANAQTFAHLPMGWSILYHLARLDKETLERLIQEGLIHPALKLWETRKLAAQFHGKAIKARPPGASLRE